MGIKHFFGAWFCGFLFGVGVGGAFWTAIGRNQEREDAGARAVKAGDAVWKADENGKPVLTIIRKETP